MDRLGIVIPCKNESAFLAESLSSLGRTVSCCAERAPGVGVRVVLVDDHSTDESRAIADGAARESDWLEVLSSPGAGEAAARTTGTAYTFTNDASVGWVIACDVDQTYEPGWLASWVEFIGGASYGAIGGRDRISATSAQMHPECAVALLELDQLVARIESIVGVINLNGHNHAISRRSWDEAGPYKQAYRSLSPGQPPVPIVGADWDFGVRLRRHGHPLSFIPNPTIYSGRRFHEAPLDFVSGQTYSREFGSRGRDYLSGEPVSVSAYSVEDVRSARTMGIRKILLHYLAKPLVVEPTLVRDDLVRVAFGRGLQHRLADWLAAHPVADFEEDRDDTLLRIAPALVDTFFDELCEVLDTHV